MNATGLSLSHYYFRNKRQERRRMKHAKLRVHTLSRPRRQRTMKALLDAAEYVASNHPIEGAIIILSSRNGDELKVIAAGALEHNPAAITALAKAKLSLLTS